MRHSIRNENDNREMIYQWKRRYDESLESLADRSYRPYNYLKQHTEGEFKLITDMRRLSPNAGLVVFCVKLQQRGYVRSITGLYRILVKQCDIAVKPANPKYIPKLYEAMQYPGQCVQIDVKHVPVACIESKSYGSRKFY